MLVKWTVVICVMLFLEISNSFQRDRCYIQGLTQRNFLPGTFYSRIGNKYQNFITPEDVEEAFQIAMTYEKNDFPPDDTYLNPEHVKEYGEIILETSKNLAKKFRLNARDVYYQLPQMDVSTTSIAKICPSFASPMKCVPGKYSRLDGLCNNLNVPTWGATRAVFNRLIPPVYNDGVSSPRIYSVAGGRLPSSRVVSATIHRDEGFHDHAASLLIVAWGQFMDHDFTLTATPIDPITRNEPESCCGRLPLDKDRYCDEISIPPSDAFYALFGQRCLDFVRGFPGVRQDCRLGSLEQFNILTSVIDGNTVYGGSYEAGRELRTMHGGLMKEHDLFSHLGLKKTLPLRQEHLDEGCTRADDTQNCFLAGEIRVNEQLILTCIHTLLMREHNRVAEILTKLNPHWDDQSLYEETRHIVIAEIQHITFNEFLPQLLGENTMKKFDLLLSKGYWDGYDSRVNPSMTAAFVTSAFRFGHSLLPSAVERWSPKHLYIASKRLSQLIRQPYDLYSPGAIDEYLLGMMNQPAQAMDDAITQEVTNHLFEAPTLNSGFDLVAFNIQRGREFGIPGYNAYREFCNLPRIRDFYDLAVVMTNKTAIKYSKIYRHVDDIDLWSGGVSERPLPGSLLGPTFTCIIAHQMFRVKKGDRFWYELPNQPSSFTSEQLYALKKTGLARLICDNSDNVETLQIFPMVLQDNKMYEY